MTEPDAAVRVVLVDDQPLLRRSLAMIIEAESDLTVVGEASDGMEAATVVGVTGPDVVLMDVRMPRVDGIEATRRTCRAPELSHTRVLVLSMFDLDEHVFHALRAGASGFLRKDTRPADLLAAIRRTHNGEALPAPSILTRLIGHYVSEGRLSTSSRNSERSMPYSRHQSSTSTSTVISIRILTGLLPPLPRRAGPALRRSARRMSGRRG